MFHCKEIWDSRIAQWMERLAQDRKVLGLTPSQAKEVC